MLNLFERLKKYWQFLPKGYLVTLFLLVILPLTVLVTLTQKFEIRKKAQEPPSDFWTPKKVFGQIDFTQASTNEVVGNRVFHPQGVLVDRGVSPNSVYIWDSVNSRILGFKSLGVCTGGPNVSRACTNNLDCPSSTCNVDSYKKADLIIGQIDEFHAGCNMVAAGDVRAPASALTICSQPMPFTLSPGESPNPNSLAVDSSQNLYVFDHWNHRVLKYNDPFSLDKTGGKGDSKADWVWGQPDFISNGCNRGLGSSSRDKNTLCGNDETGYHISGDLAGTGVDVDPSSNLWVTDGANHRVLRFAPGSTDANLVLGQSNFTSLDTTACIGDNQADAGYIPPKNFLCRPKSVKLNPTTGQLYVLDWPNPGKLMRILIYTPPFSNGNDPTEMLLGSNNGKYPYKFYRAIGLEFDPTLPDGFWVSDWENSRTLYFKKVNGNWSPTKVIGQPNLTRIGCGGVDYLCPNSPNPPWMCYACHAGGGIGIDSAGNIYLGETAPQEHVIRFPAPIPDSPQTGEVSLHRADTILVRSQLPPAVNFISGSHTFAQNAVLLANFPNGSSQLLIADQNRVLFWNDYKNRLSGSAADGVLFQNDFNSNNWSGGLIRSFDLDSQGRIWMTHGDKVEVFNGPLVNKQSPDFVIPAQINLRFGGSLTSGELIGLAFDEAKDALWVADARNHRVIRIKSPLDQTGREIDMVLGQPNANSTEANRSKDIHSQMTCPNIQPDGFSSLGIIRLDRQGNLYIIDGSHEGWQCSNNRLLEYDGLDLIPHPSKNFFADGEKIPKRVYASPNFTSNDGLPVGSPHTPISIAFNHENNMVMVVDGYGNPPGQRVFWYDNPLPSCGSPCSVPHTRVIPLSVSQASDASWDKEDNLAILDHTWQRTLFFENNIPSTPTGGPTVSPTPPPSPTPTSVTVTPTISPTLSPTLGANNIPVIQTNSPLPDGKNLNNYSANVIGSDKDVSDELTMTIKNLPPGLRMGSCKTKRTGAVQSLLTCPIIGKPSQAGVWENIVVDLKDNKGAKTQKIFKLTVNP